MGRLEIDCISRSYDDHVHTQQRADVRSSIASGVVSRLPRELCILHLRLHPGTLELTGIWPHSCAKGQCTRILRLPHEERPVAAYEDLRERLKVSRSSCRRTSCLSHCLASLTQLAASRIFAYRMLHRPMRMPQPRSSFPAGAFRHPFTRHEHPQG